MWVYMYITVWGRAIQNLICIARDPRTRLRPRRGRVRHEPLAMSCRGEATWFRDEFWRIVCVATLAIAVVTTAHTIAIALAKRTDEGESWKSIKVQRGNGEESR